MNDVTLTTRESHPIVVNADTIEVLEPSLDAVGHFTIVGFVSGRTEFVAETIEAIQDLSQAARQQQYFADVVQARNPNWRRGQ